MSYIGIDGRVVSTADAVISVMDHGLMYGIGLFETFRTYGGEPFLLERHLERLEEGCRLLGIRYVPETGEIRAWLSRLMAANGLEEAYIRLTVTAGEGALGLPSGDYKAPCQLVYIKPLPVVTDSLYAEGKALRLLKTPRNTPETPWRLKSLHYMNNIMAKRELQGDPEAVSLQAEGLMLTEQGELAEGIVSNIFFVKNGILYTPDVGTGILPGITRAVVLELADELGIPAREGRYGWEDLQQADEIFTTGSVQEIMPITRLLESGKEQLVIGDGQAGSLSQALLKAYRQKAGL